MIRMDEETKNQLLLLTITENKKSMAKMIRELIDFYEQSKEVTEHEGLQTTCEDAGTPVGE
jgi:hypothetical protein